VSVIKGTNGTRGRTSITESRARAWTFLKFS
jgi:hypothetical protein